MSDLNEAFRCGELHTVEMEGFESGMTNAEAAVNPYPVLSWQHDVWEQGRKSGIRVASKSYGY